MATSHCWFTGSCSAPVRPARTYMRQGVLQLAAGIRAPVSPRASTSRAPGSARRSRFPDRLAGDHRGVAGRLLCAGRYRAALRGGLVVVVSRPARGSSVGLGRRAGADRRATRTGLDDGLATTTRASEIARSGNVWIAMGQYFASNFTFFFCLTWLFPACSAPTIRRPRRPACSPQRR